MIRVLVPASLGLVACAAPAPGPLALFTSPAPSAPAAAPSGPADAELRAELARAADPTASALELADRLLGEARHAEALAVLDAAYARAPASAPVAAVRARVLFDMGRFAAAASAMRAGPGSARVTFDLAECERAQGHFDAARKLTATLLDEQRGDPWVQEHLELVDRLAYELRLEQQAGRRIWFSARELLAILRGGDSPKRRVEALQSLALEGDDTARAGLAIALDDAEPAVRVQALRIYAQASDDRLAVVELGLADAAPLVRAAAADLARGADARALAAPVLASLAKEADAYAFRRMHVALSALLGAKIELAEDGARDPTIRAQVVTAWRKVPLP